MKYSSKTLVNIDELSKVEEPFTLFNFVVSAFTSNSVLKVSMLRFLFLSLPVSVWVPYRQREEHAGGCLVW